ncbi:hypothetical protein KCP78_18125 [Salmonella enterica subsp. enterica]|nr:hypothetical protein KCP78_18125 [Salmonella enterica subsp. enterica]
MSRSCAVAAECSSTHGTGAQSVPGVRHNATQGMPACASASSCGSFSAGSIRIAASKLTASSGFAPGGNCRIVAHAVFQRHHRGTLTPLIINPSRTRRKIAAGTEERRNGIGFAGSQLAGANIRRVLKATMAFNTAVASGGSTKRVLRGARDTVPGDTPVQGQHQSILARFYFEQPLLPDRENLRTG